MFEKILPDIYKLEKLLEEIKDIENPESLSYVVQQSKDLVDNYVNELRGIPQELNQWLETIENLTGLSISSEFTNIARNLYIENAKNGIKKCLVNATLGLNDLMKTDTEISTGSFFINDIPIDFVFEVSPSHKLNSISQPIISEKADIDRLNEDAENRNDTYNFKISLIGDDRNERYKKIVGLKENKALNKFIFNEIYNQMLITDINLSITNKNILEIGISTEKVFVASLGTVPEAMAGYETENKSTSNAGRQGTLPMTKS